MCLRHFNVITLAVIGSFAVTGCATVDLNEMTSPAVAASPDKDFNLIERAVAKLKSAFKSKGFVAKTSRKRVKSATKILLSGLEDKQVMSVNETSSYANPAKPISVISADMSYAKQHITQTTKAAEIYLAMAPEGRKLSKDLGRLEMALMASIEASKVFEVALDGRNSDQMEDFNVSVQALRDITDEFGARVRSQKSQKLIADSAS